MSKPIWPWEDNIRTPLRDSFNREIGSVSPGGIVRGTMGQEIGSIRGGVLRTTLGHEIGRIGLGGDLRSPLGGQIGHIGR